MGSSNSSHARFQVIRFISVQYVWPIPVLIQRVQPYAPKRECDLFAVTFRQDQTTRFVQSDLGSTLTDEETVSDKQIVHSKNNVWNGSINVLYPTDYNVSLDLFAIEGPNNKFSLLTFMTYWRRSAVGKVVLSRLVSFSLFRLLSTRVTAFEKGELYHLVSSVNDFCQCQ